jgi:hypothetical protein
MKMRNIICSMIAAGLALTWAGCATEKEKEAKLEGSAKVSRAEAEKTALAKVPGGSIKEGGIEKEKGKVVWSFDIATPGTSDITEVQIDAQTGDVVAVDKETAAQEAKEKKKEKKGKEEDDEKNEKK